MPPSLSVRERVAERALGERRRFPGGPRRTRGEHLPPSRTGAGAGSRWPVTSSGKVDAVSGRRGWTERVELPPAGGQGSRE